MHDFHKFFVFVCTQGFQFKTKKPYYNVSQETRFYFLRKQGGWAGGLAAAKGLASLNRKLISQMVGGKYTNRMADEISEYQFQACKF